MHRTVTVVRFTASQVLLLADIAANGRMDALWFIRGSDCKLQTPDEQLSVSPCSVEGDESLLYDTRTAPRVEVLELHNHVIRTLLLTDVDDGTFMEIRFDDEDQFCLVLRHGLREIAEEKPVTAPECWMRNLFRFRRLF